MEDIPNIEDLDALRSRVVDMLKERGPEDQEAIDMLIEWTKRKEQEVELNRTPESEVEFEKERAQLYLDAGLVDDAKQAFEDAYLLACNLGLEEESHRIAERILSL